MQHETLETRLARLEEAMVSVKGDTSYLRKHLDAFQHKHWSELLKITGRVAAVSAVVSVVVGCLSVAVAHAVWR